MNVLLINPPRHEMHVENIWRKINTQLPSLGLAYIASYLRETEGVNVKILDLQVEPTSVDELTTFLRQFHPEFTGITATTVTTYGAFDIARIVKSILPHTKIVFGGAHPTALPEEALRKEYVDFVVRGEGEIAFRNLIKNPPEKVNGLSYKHNGKYIHNQESEFIQNLDDLPFPAHDLLPMNKYKPSLGTYKRLPAMSMVCGRGCPGCCTFCYSKPFGKRLRFRSADNIIDELQHLISHYRIKEIYFYDENLTTNRKLVQDVCHKIITENVDVTWTCQSRIDTIKEEDLNLMARAGCHQIGYGIESADTQILKNIKKPISLQRARDVVKMTQKAGIDARVNFMFGSPGETVDSMEKTMKFAIDINPDFAVFNITTPLPGTEMFEWAKSNGYLKTEDWHDYDFSRHIMALPTVNSKEVEEFYNKSYRRFYFRPQYIIHRLMKIRSFSDVVLNINTLLALTNTHNN